LSSEAPYAVNEIGELIWDLLDEETTFDALVRDLRAPEEPVARERARPPA
jgi:Coenzyme PQQ synthesis protein D (PqqD)